MQVARLFVCWSVIAIAAYLWVGVYRDWCRIPQPDPVVFRHDVVWVPRSEYDRDLRAALDTWAGLQAQGMLDCLEAGVDPVPVPLDWWADIQDAIRRDSTSTSPQRWQRYQ